MSKRIVIALGGNALGNTLPEQAAAVDVAVLRRPFGLFLLYSGASMLWSARKKE